MCTRYFMDRDENTISSMIDAALATKLAKKFQISMSKPMKTCGEVCPTDVAPVIAPNNKGERTVYPMKWGFTVTIEGRQKPVVNARIETAAVKGLFKEAWHRHRCIVPASWYFEWQHFADDKGRVRPGDRYIIQPAGASITWLGGLYRIEDGFPVFVILTMPPTEEILKIHDRMPLILPEGMIDRWINPSSDPEGLLPFAVTDMCAEAQA